MKMQMGWGVVITFIQHLTSLHMHSSTHTQKTKGWCIVNGQRYQSTKYVRSWFRLKEFKKREKSRITLICNTKQPTNQPTKKQNNNENLCTTATESGHYISLIHFCSPFISPPRNTIIISTNTTTTHRTNDRKHTGARAPAAQHSTHTHTHTHTRELARAHTHTHSAFIQELANIFFSNHGWFLLSPMLRIDNLINITKLFVWKRQIRA